MIHWEIRRWIRWAVQFQARGNVDGEELSLWWSFAIYFQLRGALPYNDAKFAYVWLSDLLKRKKSIGS